MKKSNGKGTDYQKIYKILSLIHTILFSSIVIIVACLVVIYFLNASYPLLLRDVIYFNNPLKDDIEPPKIVQLIFTGLGDNAILAFLVTFFSVRAKNAREKLC